MDQLRFRITGTSALLMHNGQLSDPENDWAGQLKAVTTKKNKTKADREEMRRIEFMGGLYHDPEIGPYIPEANLIASIIEGGRKDKQGRALEESITVVEHKVKLEYKGPRDMDKMYAAGMFDVRGVSAQGKKGGSRVQRTRPIFLPGWKAEFTVAFRDRIVNRETIIQALEVAGDLTGLLDGRPRYGKFEVQVLE